MRDRVCSWNPKEGNLESDWGGSQLYRAVRFFSLWHFLPSLSAIKDLRHQQQHQSHHSASPPTTCSAFTIHLATTEETFVRPEFQHQNKMRITTWARRASCSSASAPSELLVKVHSQRSPRSPLTRWCWWGSSADPLHPWCLGPRGPAGAAGEVRFEVWHPRALENIAAWGRAPAATSSLHSVRPVLAKVSHTEPHLSPKPLMKASAASVQPNHTGDDVLQPALNQSCPEWINQEG